jgi:hypothetical protein
MTGVVASYGPPRGRFRSHRGWPEPFRLFAVGVSTHFPPRSVPCAHFPCRPALQPSFLRLASPSQSPKAEVAAEEGVAQEGVAQEGERAVLAAEQQAAVPLVQRGVPVRQVVLRGRALLLHQERRPARERRLPPLPAERPEPARRRHPRLEGPAEVRFPAVRDLRLSARLGSRPARHPITCPQQERPQAFLAPQRRRAPPAVRQPCRQTPLQGERQRRLPLRAVGVAQPIGPWGAWT